MKHILSLNEYKDDSKRNFYILFDELVYVDDINRWGDEIKVEYTKQDGSHHTYIGDDRDFREDFVETTDTFKVVKSEPTIKPEIKKETPKKIKYKLVFYIGKTQIETIQSNIDNSGLAYGLKNKLGKESKYKTGRIEVEKYETY